MTPVRPTTYGLDPSGYTFSVAKYQWMVEVGILTTADKVELLEEHIIRKYPRTPRHDGTLHIAYDELDRFIPEGLLLRNQAAVVLADSQPEPDLSVVRGGLRSFMTRHAGASDAHLVIEVADSSLLRDQRDKTRIYARAGIPVYWIINLVDRRIEVYTQPSGPTAVPAYGAFQTYQPGDAVPLILDGATAGSVPAADLLP
jgi:Uma2 family endonuclease